MDYYICSTILMAAAGGAEELLRVPGWTFGWSRILLFAFRVIGNYGWGVVVFTLVLKLIIFPLDFYQRFMTRKNAKINERIKPELEKLKEATPDRGEFARKQMALNKKHGLRPLRACLPAIVTAIIFITLWQTMLSIGQYQNVRTYFVLHDHFVATEQQIFDERSEAGYNVTEARTAAIEGAQAAVRELYRYGITREDGTTIGPMRQNFLWIRSVWVPDVWWQEPIRDANGFFSNINNFYRGRYGDITRDSISRNRARDRYNVDMWLERWLPRPATLMQVQYGQITFRDGAYRPPEGQVQYSIGVMIPNNDGTYRRPTNYEMFGGDFGAQAVSDFNSDLNDIMWRYNTVMGGLMEDYGNRPNGFLILTVLAVVLNFITQFFMMRQQSKAGGMGGMGMGDMGGGAMGGQMAKTMKIMMLLFPIMIGFFAATNASIFAIYMVVNALGTLTFMLSTTLIFYLMDKKKGDAGKVKIQRYGRPDPNETK